VRIGHPSPERCAYPSDHEEQAAMLSMLPCSEGSISDKSSGIGTPPPNQGAPKLARLTKRRDLCSPTAPYNIHKDRMRRDDQKTALKQTTAANQSN
ncbi:hypothetical protein H0H92_012489, partial [Tricholoma furcatifolium]